MIALFFLEPLQGSTGSNSLYFHFRAISIHDFSCLFCQFMVNTNNSSFGIIFHQFQPYFTVQFFASVIQESINLILGSAHWMCEQDVPFPSSILFNNHYSNAFVRFLIMFSNFWTLSLNSAISALSSPSLLPFWVYSQYLFLLFPVFLNRLRDIPWGR